MKLSKKSNYTPSSLDICQKAMNEKKEKKIWAWKAILEYALHLI